VELISDVVNNLQSDKARCLQSSREPTYINSLASLYIDMLFICYIFNYLHTPPPFGENKVERHEEGSQFFASQKIKIKTNL
jgi:hypothetical protein